MIQFVFILLIELFTLLSWIFKKLLIQYVLFLYRFQKAYSYPRFLNNLTLCPFSFWETFVRSNSKLFQESYVRESLKLGTSGSRSTVKLGKVLDCAE